MLFRREPMTGQEYEDYVADVLRQQGFCEIERTAVTGDYGVDLIARHGRHRYAVQCKYYSGGVGGFAVQEAVAGMAYYGCEKALVVTNSYLTKNAHALAKANGVDVIEHVDPEARTFLERRKPWQIVLLAVEFVLFGLILSQMQQQGTFTWEGCALLALFLFPLPYALIFLCKWLLKLLQ